MLKAEPTSRSTADRKLDLKEVLADLVTDGVVAEQNADEILMQTGTRKRVENHPLVIIANHKLDDAREPERVLTLERLTEWLAGRYKLSYLRIDPLKINVGGVADVVSYAYAERHRILPVEVGSTEVTFATSEPGLTEWMDELGRILQKHINRVVSNPVDVERYRVEFYGVSRSVKGATSTSEDQEFMPVTSLEQLVELGQAGNLDANDRHIVHIVDWLLQYAFEQRASDIHLEPRRDTGNIRFRIDGVLHDVYQIPAPVMGAVTSRIKTLGRMDVAEKRRPQDGRIKTRTPEEKEVEMRLSTMPTAFGEKLVMRIFDPDVLVKGFCELGFGKEESAVWEEMVHKPDGIILVTGPTGSGKTTTLYSTLRTLATTDVNVCTVEDPIEMVESSFNQMQVHHNIGLDFATGIRTLMRQDPDIIMIGEIRDLETAEMAIQAALTGHLVLSTLHTNDSVSAITRLLDIGVPYYLLRATLLGIVAQRLVRTLCPHCKQPDTIDPEQWEHLASPWRVSPPVSSARPTGCLECRNTGYLGRIGLYEILRITPEIQQIIASGFDEADARRQGYRQGMRPLRLSGMQKINTGLTTIEEVLKVAPVKDEI